MNFRVIWDCNSKFLGIWDDYLTLDTISLVILFFCDIFDCRFIEVWTLCLFFCLVCFLYLGLSILLVCSNVTAVSMSWFGLDWTAKPGTPPFWKISVSLIIEICSSHFFTAVSKCSSANASWVGWTSFLGTNCTDPVPFPFPVDALAWVSICL